MLKKSDWLEQIFALMNRPCWMMWWASMVHQHLQVLQGHLQTVPWDQRQDLHECLDGQTRPGNEDDCDPKAVPYGHPSGPGGGVLVPWQQLLPSAGWYVLRDQHQLHLLVAVLANWQKMNRQTNIKEQSIYKHSHSQVYTSYMLQLEVTKSRMVEYCGMSWWSKSNVPLPLYCLEQFLTAHYATT